MTLIIDCLPFHWARSCDVLASQVRRGQVVDIKETVTNNMLAWYHKSLETLYKMKNRPRDLQFSASSSTVPMYPFQYLRVSPIYAANLVNVYAAK
ncbi:hypothetical protein BELL_0164g00030 [Botrytis elliptica]|uniref:Uncharacterized protein n=1 Tax=Botrytis elliptica TaxID=278938 RepID=A0A4Z1JSN6_9HELO|nr:hypothetical protein BELL_0164g00030 [Botrytis elliptica]